MYVLKDTSAAEDVAQNVFLKLWNKRESLVDIKDIKSYVARMAKNAAFDELDKNKGLDEESKIPLRFEEEHPENDQEIKEALEKAVALLSPKCRLVFSLSRFEGLTNEEIADHLSLSIRTVETQISLAFKKFRTDLKYCFVEFLGGFLVTAEFISNLL